MLEIPSETAFPRTLGCQPSLREADTLQGLGNGPAVGSKSAPDAAWSAVPGAASPEDPLAGAGGAVWAVC